MRIPIEQMNEGLEALANAREISADCSLSQHEMGRMPDQILKARLSWTLAERLSVLVEEMAQRREAIARLQMPTHDGDTITVFRASVVLMKPEDYSLLCRLLTHLVRLQQRECGS